MYRFVLSQSAEICMDLRNSEINVFLLFFFPLVCSENGTFLYNHSNYFLFLGGGKTLCGVMEREKELNSRVFFEWPRYVLLCGLYQELNIGLD